MKELALHLLDLAMNCTRAGATLLEITIEEYPAEDLFRMTISDNGSGMDPNTLARVSDPFYTTRTTRKVGLGIPLLKQSAEQSGGKLEIESQTGIGTKVTATLKHSHIDRPPAGDLPGVMTMLAAGNPDIRLIYKHHTPGAAFTLDTNEVKEMLDGLPLNHPLVQQTIKEFIRNNLEAIGAEFGDD